MHAVASPAAMLPLPAAAARRPAPLLLSSLPSGAGIALDSPALLPMNMVRGVASVQHARDATRTGLGLTDAPPLGSSGLTRRTLRAPPAAGLAARGRRRAVAFRGGRLRQRAPDGSLWWRPRRRRRRQRPRNARAARRRRGGVAGGAWRAPPLLRDAAAARTAAQEAFLTCACLFARLSAPQAGEPAFTWRTAGAPAPQADGGATAAFACSEPGCGATKQARVPQPQKADARARAPRVPT
jgi:hypothetical protein